MNAQPSDSQPGGVLPPADIVSTPRGGGRRWKPRVVRDGEIQSAMVLLAKGKLARPSRAFLRRLREVEERLDNGQKLSRGDVAYLRGRVAARLATSNDPKDVLEALRTLETIAGEFPILPETPRLPSVRNIPPPAPATRKKPEPEPILEVEDDPDDLDLPG